MVFVAGADTAHQAVGLAGLKPVDRSDQGSSRAIPEPVQDLLLALRAERPKDSVRSLIRAARLAGKIGAEVRLAPSTLYRFLAAHGASVKTHASPGEPDSQAFSFPHANDLWVADVTHGPALLEPGRGARSAKTYLIALLDDTTRMAPYSASYVSESAARFAEAFRQALLRRGVPRRLYVDNRAHLVPAPPGREDARVRRVLRFSCWRSRAASRPTPAVLLRL